MDMGHQAGEDEEGAADVEDAAGRAEGKVGEDAAAANRSKCSARPKQATI